jgi:hypothetical protein
MMQNCLTVGCITEEEKDVRINAGEKKLRSLLGIKLVRCHDQILPITMEKNCCEIIQTESKKLLLKNKQPVLKSFIKSLELTNVNFISFFFTMIGEYIPCLSLAK